GRCRAGLGEYSAGCALCSARICEDPRIYDCCHAETGAGHRCEYCCLSDMTGLVLLIACANLADLMRSFRRTALRRPSLYPISCWVSCRARILTSRL